MDEAHEYLGAHKARDHEKLLAIIGGMHAQTVLTTGTLPVSTEALLLTKAHLNFEPPTHATIREPLVRPELAHHVLIVPKHPCVFGATEALAGELLGTLDHEERMIVFVMGKQEAESFGCKLDAPRYYSGMEPEVQASNIAAWKSGQSRLIFATPALIQGIDHPSVRYVIFHSGSYGLVSYYQGAGRGGRSGSRCDIFTVMADQRATSHMRGGEEDLEARAMWGDFVATKSCRVSVLSECFDGKPATCESILGQVKCDNCNPEDHHHQLALRVVRRVAGTSTSTSTAGKKRAVEDISRDDGSEYWDAVGTIDTEAVLEIDRLEQNCCATGPKKPKLCGLAMTEGEDRSANASTSKHANMEPYTPTMSRPSTSSLSSASLFRPHRLGHREGTSSRLDVSSPCPPSSAAFDFSTPLAPSAPHSAAAPLRRLDFSKAPVPEARAIEVGGSITRRALGNSQGLWEKRRKSAHLNKVMPILENYCAVCLVLTGKFVTSAKIGPTVGASLDVHKPFRDCHNPLPHFDFNGFITFRSKIRLPGEHRYCFLCGMPKGKSRDKLEPTCHTGSSSSLKGHTSLGSPSGPNSNVCPFSNIVQATLFTAYHHPPTMKALAQQFPGLGIANPEEPVPVDQWVYWLCKDEADGEYWKGLEVFLFIMTSLGLTP